ncbi:hypothetical protein AMTR_s00086p00136610 [Amborella trichopoda]|uniref:Uncharacterized protein n=1 Tax=Amborella trichopoda TaxID=13333 RepID=W1P5F7_AMBTC|nr:hypothetical protein AMTR_s00086p00136610 [Amborella trichopoda]
MPPHEQAEDLLRILKGPTISPSLHYLADSPKKDAHNEQFFESNPPFKGSTFDERKAEILNLLKEKSLNQHLEVAPLKLILEEGKTKQDASIDSTIDEVDYLTKKATSSLMVSSKE